MLEYLKVLCNKNQIKMLVLLLLGSLFSVFLEFISIGSVPIFAGILINGGNENYLSNLINLDILNNINQEKLLLYGSITLGIIFLLKNTFLSILIYLEGRLIKSIRIKLGDKMFRTYLDKEYKFHLKTNPSILLRNVMGEVSQTTTVILSYLKLVREFLVLIAIFILLIITDFIISFSIFIFMSFFVVIFFGLTKKIIEKNGKLIQAISAIQIQNITQSFSAIKEIKMLNKEDYVNKETVKNMFKFENPYLVTHILTSLPRLFLETLLVFTLVGVTLVLINLEQTFLSILPTLTLLAVSAVRLVPCFNSISSSLARIKAYRPSYKLVYSNLKNNKKENANLKTEALSFEKELILENVDFSYDDHKGFNLKDINLTINIGSKVGIIGKSGSGKSTFINLITGLLGPESGLVLSDKLDIKKNIKKWQSLVGYVPQDIYLLDDTIKKNIAIGEEETQIDNSKLDLAIKSAELEDYIGNLPQGLNTVVGNRGVRISGGQKQRIGIARALYFDRKILILDEATNSLDENNETKILNNIMSQYHSKTLICIAHNHKIFEKFDNVVCFEEGKIVKIGSYRDIIKN